MSQVCRITTDSLTMGVTTMLYHHCGKNSKPTRATGEGFSAVDLTIPEGEGAINVSRIHIEQRFPKKGWQTNLHSNMIVYMIYGEALFYYSEDGNTNLEMLITEDDTLLVPALLPYYWIPIASTLLLVTSFPGWDEKQSINL